MSPISLTDEATDPIVDAENPWPGLAAFTERLSRFFHGRRAEADDLMRRVERRKLTVLFGQSGLGKSSLLQAGLFPRLRSEGYVPVPIRLDHAASAPHLTEQVIIASGRAIVKSGGRLGDADEGIGNSLWEFFHRSALILETDDREPIRPLLVFDQFEEIFAIAQASPATRSRASAFLDELADLVENRAPVSLEGRLDADSSLYRRLNFDDRDFRVLICLREDYVPHLEGLSRNMPSIVENRMRLTRLNGERALEAVTGPGGSLISKQVARQVVRFIGGERPGSSDVQAQGLSELEVDPSLLSLFCSELNNRRQAERLGRITAGLLDGSRDLILQHFYDRCFADQPDGLRTFVEEKLVTPSGHRENIAVDVALKALDDYGVSPSALDTLVRHRLLHYEDRLNIRRVELTHDILTRVVKENREERISREAMAATERQAREAKEQALAVTERQAREAREKLKRQRRRFLVFGSTMTAAFLIACGTGWKLSRSNEATKEELDGTKQSLDYTKQSLDYTKQDLQVKDQDLTIAEKARSDAAQELDKAEKTRKAAQKRLIDGLILQGDVLRQVGRQRQAEKGLIQARRLLEELGEGPLRADLALLDLYRGDPPPLMALRGHTAKVNCVALSPDGRIGLSGGDDETVRIWDLTMGILKGTFTGHHAKVRSVCFSATGKRVLSADDDLKILLWDLDRPQVEGKPFLGSRTQVLSICFSPDGNRALSFHNDESLNLWDLQSESRRPQELPQVLAGGSLDDDLPTGMTCVAFSPRGDTALCRSNERELTLWDLTTNVPKPRLLLSKRHSGAVIFVEYLDDHTAFSLGKGNERKYWDLRTNHEMTGQELSGWAKASKGPGRSTVLVDSPPVASSKVDAKVTLLDLKKNESVRTVSAYTGRVNAAAASADGQALVGCTDDPAAGQGHTLRLLDLREDREVLTLAGHELVVTSVAFSPDGRIALSGSRDGTLKFWDVATGRLLRTIVAHGEGGVSSVAFSSDGTSVLSGGWDSAMRLWEVATGKEAERSPFTATDQDEVTGVAFSNDGLKVFASSEDRTLKSWEKSRDRPFQVLTGAKEQSSGLRGLAVAPIGLVVATCSTDKWVKLWDLKRLAPDGKYLLETTYKHDGPVNSVAFSPPDGHQILSGGDDQMLRLWDRQQKRATFLRGHTDAVTDVAIAAGGRVALSSSRDRTLKLWDLGKVRWDAGDADRELDVELRTFTGHRKGVASVAIASDRNAQPAGGDTTNIKALLSGGNDKVVKLWRIDRVAEYLRYLGRSEKDTPEDSGRLDAQQSKLSENPNDPDADALAVLGQWYAFRGMNSWAVELLEKARLKGASIKSLELARCYWNLAEAGGAQGDRAEVNPQDFRQKATREFESDGETQESSINYVNTCLDAVHSPPITSAREIKRRPPPVPTPSRTKPGSVALSLPKYSAPKAPLRGRLRVGGGGTTQKFIDPLLRSFVEQNSGVTSDLILRGSNTAPKGLGDDEYNLGVMSRRITPEEKARIKQETGREVIEVKLALDALLVLVNEKNPVPGISLTQLKFLYGEDRLRGHTEPRQTWRNLGAGGDQADLEVVPYGIKEQKNGTVETFRQVVLNRGPLNLSSDIGEISQPDKEFGQAVAADRRGISYNIDHKLVPGARVLGVAAKEGGDYVLPDPKNISSGDYPIRRYIWAYFLPTDESSPTPVVPEFLRFALSLDGQQVIAAHDAVPLSEKDAKEQTAKIPY